MFYYQFHIGKTIFADHIDQFMHSFRLKKEIHKSIFKSHQHMKLFKNTSSHNYHGQIFVLIDFFFCCNGIFPAFGAFTQQIRNFDIFTPFSHIFDHLVFFCYIRYCCRSIFRKQNQCSPLIIRIGSTDSIASDQFKTRISRDSSEHGKRIT